ncbi:MAG: MBL fold metallo-hydrolase [Phycisphaerales bacterium]|nr:MBL fold metallo-hydrolase [Phycisphaerales bacterium]
MTDTFHFHVLGSGSRGNATVVTFTDAEGRHRHLMIDLGLGPRTSRQRCQDIDLDLDLVEAAVLTHIDSDHCTATWQRTLQRNGMPVYVAGGHVEAAQRAGIPRENLRRLGQSTEIAASLRIRSVVAPHDRSGSMALRLEHHARSDGPLSLGWATDIGRFIPAVEDLLRGCDAIAIESNYDHEMQVLSDRPQYLKDRVMGGNGHLSNDEAHEAILRLAATTTPTAVVLLHLSQDCNCPDLVQRFWREVSPGLADHLHITSQSSPTGPIQVEAGMQATDKPITDHDREPQALEH